MKKKNSLKTTSGNAFFTEQNSRKWTVKKLLNMSDIGKIVENWKFEEFGTGKALKGLKRLENDNLWWTDFSGPKTSWWISIRKKSRILSLDLQRQDSRNRGLMKRKRRRACYVRSSNAKCLTCLEDDQDIHRFLWISWFRETKILWWQNSLLANSEWCIGLEVDLKCIGLCNTLMKGSKIRICFKMTLKTKQTHFLKWNMK